MPEARDRLLRPVDVAEQYRRRLTRFGYRGMAMRYSIEEHAVPFRWGATPLTGTQGAVRAAAAAAAAAGGVGTPIRRGTLRAPRASRVRVRGRGSSAMVIGRENISPAGRGQLQGRGSALPSWYPRGPLQDITSIVRVQEAYQRRREQQLRDGENEQPGTPMPRDQTAADHPSLSTPGAHLEHSNQMVTPFPTLRTRLGPPSLHKAPKILIDVLDDQNAQDWESMTPQRKLLHSIDNSGEDLQGRTQKVAEDSQCKEGRKGEEGPNFNVNALIWTVSSSVKVEANKIFGGKEHQQLSFGAWVDHLLYDQSPG